MPFLALEGTTFMSAVTEAITQVLTWIGTFIGSLLGTGTNTSLSPLLPLFAIGVAISAILLGRFMPVSLLIAGNSQVDNQQPSRKGRFNDYPEREYRQASGNGVQAVA